MSDNIGVVGSGASSSAGGTAARARAGSSGYTGGAGTSITSPSGGCTGGGASSAYNTGVGASSAYNTGGGDELDDPHRPRTSWSALEDEVIVRAVRELGPRWCAVAARLPARTDQAIRNRWNRLQQRARVQARQAENMRALMASAGPVGRQGMGSG
jgi:hypothetical protein